MVLKVGSDDQCKIYLNGKLVHQRRPARTYVADQDSVTGVELKAGLNVLVFKVVNEEGTWLGSVRLTDALGQPVKGLRLLLEPMEEPLRPRSGVPQQPAQPRENSQPARDAGGR